MSKRVLPEYTTEQNFRCPECGELSTIIALDNSTNYAGTHCTHGLSGTHYPANWGKPVCDQCHAFVDDYEYGEDYYE